MADRYWRGGAGTWSTTSTTNWSATSNGTAGASVPTAADNVFFDQAGTYTVTLSGALACLDITVSAGTVTFATTGSITVSGSMSLITGTVWSSTGQVTFNSATTGKTITTNGTSLGGNLLFNSTTGSWSLGSSITTASIAITELRAGTLNLNNFTLTTGIFSSSNTTTRSIEFGTGNIALVHTSAAQTVLSMGTATNFTWTGTGAFTAAATVTRTYTFGSTAGGTRTNSPNVVLTGSGTAVQSFTTASWFNKIDYGGTVYTHGAVILNLNNLILSTGAAIYSALTINMVGTGSITGNSKSIGALNINNVDGVTSLASAFTLTASATTTLNSGTLNLNGFTLTTGIFSSNNSTTRAIQFGSSNIALTHATAATTVVNINTATGLTCTGTGGFTAVPSTTRTFNIAVAGGSLTSVPNLSFGVGASTQTISTGSWLKSINFGTSTCTASGSANITETLTLSTGGTYTAFGVTTRGNCSIISNGKTIGTFIVNNDTYTTTLPAALTCGTYTQTAGTINFAGFNLTCTGAATYTAGTLNNISVISCTNWTCAGTFTMTQGTISSPIFTITGGFNYDNAAATISSATVTHTSGTVNINALCMFGTATAYTLTAGNLNLNTGNLWVGTFISSGSGVRTIAFGSYNIILNTTTAALVNLSMATLNGFNWTGTGGFVSADASITRTYTLGTSTIGMISATAPNLTIGAGSAVTTITSQSTFNKLDFSGSSSVTTTAATVYPNNLILNTGLVYAINPVFGSTGTIDAKGSSITTINIGAGATLTLLSNLTTTGTSVLSQATATLNLNNYNWNSATISYTGLVTLIFGTGIITCTTWNNNGPAFIHNSGTINCTTSFILTSGSFTIGANGTFGATPLFTHTLGTFTLGRSVTLAATANYQFIQGTINLQDFNLTIGRFSTSTSTLRSVAFGSGNIILADTTSGATALSGSDCSNFTSTGTGGFTADASVPRTYQWGTFAGSIANGAPLTFTGSGTEVQTITTGGYFRKLDFGNTAFNPGTTTINVASLTLSTNGTFSGLSVACRDTGTLINNSSSTITALSTNLLGTTTLGSSFSTGTATFGSGTFDFNSFNLTVTGFVTRNGSGTLLNIGTLNCGTFTTTGGTFAPSTGTLNATTSFTISAGTFNFYGTFTLNTPLLTQTGGTISLQSAVSIPNTQWTWTTGGSAYLNNFSFTISKFVSNSNSQAGVFDFGTGNIYLTHTSAPITSSQPQFQTTVGSGGFVIDALTSKTVSMNNYPNRGLSYAYNLTISSGSVPLIPSGFGVKTFDLSASTMAFASPTSLSMQNLILPSVGGINTNIRANLGVDTINNIGCTIQSNGNRFSIGYGVPSGYTITALDAFTATSVSLDTGSGSGTLDLGGSNWDYTTLGYDTSLVVQVAGYIGTIAQANQGKIINFGTIKIKNLSIISDPNGVYTGTFNFSNTFPTANNNSIYIQYIGTTQSTSGKLDVNWDPGSRLISPPSIISSGAINFNLLQDLELVQDSNTGAVVYTSATPRFDLLSGTLNLNNYNMKVNLFCTSTESWTRVVNTGTTGSITCRELQLPFTNSSGGGNYLANTTNFSWTGTGEVIIDTTIGVSKVAHSSISNTTPPNIRYLNGSYNSYLTSPVQFNNIDFGTWSGGLDNISAGGTVVTTCWGNFTTSPNMYYITSPVLDFRLYNTIGNSHTVNITNSNFLLYIFHKLGASTATLASNINVLGQFNFELGVLNLNNYNLNCFAITSSGVIGAVRTIVGPGTLNPTSNVTISTITGRSGVGITGTGYTINMTGTGNKTFAGGGGIFGTINNASAQLTITGSNTFDDITSTTKPGIVRVTAGTTQTVNNFTLSGSAAGRITLNSVTAGTQFTLSKPSGTVNTYYLDIKDCNATGGAVWNTDSNTSVNSGNNLGWIFTSLVIVVSAVLGQFFAFF